MRERRETVGKYIMTELAPDVAAGKDFTLSCYNLARQFAVCLGSVALAALVIARARGLPDALGRHGEAVRSIPHRTVEEREVRRVLGSLFSGVSGCPSVEPANIKVGCTPSIQRLFGSEPKTVTPTSSPRSRR